MLDLNTLILAIAATLFVIAIGALLMWAFRTFFGGRTSAHGFLRPRDRRLGVVETASVDQRRKLVLIRRATSSTSSSPAARSIWWSKPALRDGLIWSPRLRT